MVEIVVLDQDAALYAGAIRGAMPEATVHAVASAGAAAACGGGADVLVALAHEVPDALVAAMPRLRWIQALTTGTDHLAGLASLPPAVTLTSARGIHGPQMAELAVMAMLALSRNLRGMLANQAQARWQRWPQPLLLGKTAVLVGVGAIGEALAPHCKGFGMRVVGVSDGRGAAPGFDAIVPRAQLAQAAAAADFLVVLVPYEAATHRIVSRDVIAAMRPSAFLLNLARGKVVDEPALAEALQAGRIAGAGLDVFEVEPLPPGSPLWGMANVILTPHVGGLSDNYAAQATPLLLANLAAYAAGDMEGMRNVVRR